MCPIHNSKSLPNLNTKLADMTDVSILSMLYYFQKPRMSIMVVCEKCIRQHK